MIWNWYGKSLLPRYPRIDWKRVMGMRDVLSHRYFDVDTEVVFSVCADHIDELAGTIRRILDDLAPATDQTEPPGGRHRSDTA